MIIIGWMVLCSSDIHGIGSHIYTTILASNEGREDKSEEQVSVFMVF